MSEAERDALYRFMVDVIAASTACGADPNSYVFEEGTPSPEETAAAEAAYEKSLGIAPSTDCICFEYHRRHGLSRLKK